jgi:membrane associated rhomboid family serine protease
MIPLRDTTQSRNYPVVNTLLIAMNVLLFFVQMMQGPRQDEFIFIYGLVPARYSVPEIGAHFTSFQQVLALISFMFLHGGFWHLLGNMWSLYTWKTAWGPSAIFCSISSPAGRQAFFTCFSTGNLPFPRSAQAERSPG